jgi:type IV pilus assembly protein PilN
MINLLPWREELRQKRKKEFLMAALGAVLMGAALTFVTKVYFQSQINYQDRLNEILRAEIVELDRQIAEINELDAQKDRLLARMEIIEQLERSRPESVHLIDQAVDILPEGVYLTALNQQGRQISFAGVAQSSTRVSAMMRNVDGSEWLREPGLGIVEYEGDGPIREGDFALVAQQIPMSEGEEGAE